MPKKLQQKECGIPSFCQKNNPHFSWGLSNGVLMIIQIKTEEMNNSRAILSGALTWLFVAIAFSVLGYIPVIKDSLNQQTLIIAVLIVPFAILGASVYYRNGNKGNGVIIGLIMVATALVLDALITVPFIEMPKGGSYKSFYAYPLLWLLVLVNIATVYFYWRLKVKRI